METIPQDLTQPEKSRPGWLLISGTGLLVLLCMVVEYRNTMLRTGNMSAAIGGAAGPLFSTVVVALLFSISKRFRNKRSQTKVALWTLVVCLIAGVGKMSDSWNQAVVRGINANCPKMIDAETRMDGAVAGPDNLITIKQTAVALNGSGFDRTAWRKTVVPKLRASALNAEFVQKLLKRGLSLRYRYTGRDGVLLDEITFVPADLQK